MREIFFSSSRVLTYIIKRCYLKNYPINQAKAQRLLYCSYGSVMALFDMRLTDERPITWEAGPIFPRALFDHMHHQLNFADPQNPLEQNLCQPAILYVIDQTVDNFGAMAAEELTEFLTAPGTPWYEVSNKGEDLGIIMNDELIRKYFAEHVVNPEAYCGPTMEIAISHNEPSDSIWA
ncbi:Panacea domain-containing protein [Anaerobiospirillum succiniciproducens]|uniref:Panacea domain-containing protein n=1 Tax=Anaerobiospirillum succiniciproducens TaxID=13335 RepID=UPI003F8AA083